MNVQVNLENVSIFKGFKSFLVVLTGRKIYGVWEFFLFSKWTVSSLHSHTNKSRFQKGWKCFFLAFLISFPCSCLPREE